MILKMTFNCLNELKKLHIYYIIHHKQDSQNYNIKQIVIPQLKSQVFTFIPINVLHTSEIQLRSRLQLTSVHA